MKKNITKILLVSAIPIISFISTVSCSSNSEENKDENQQNNIAQLIKNKKIIINVNKLGIPKEYFIKYKNNEIERQKLFFIQYNELNLNLNLNVLDVFVDDQTINAKLKLEDLDSKEFYEYDEMFIGYTFNTEEQYFKAAYQEISQSINLKNEYKNEKIINLIRKTSSNEEFINSFIDKNYALKNIIGLDCDFGINSQNLNMTNHITNYFKINLKLFKENQNVTPSNSSIAYLNLNNDQKSTFTLINFNDLSNSQLLSNPLLNSSYFGPTFIRSNNEEKKIIINVNLSGKNIIGDLDFSHFTNIEFNSLANFSGNNITNLIFNPESTIYNMNPYMFSRNSLTTVDLPKYVFNYNANCFDSSVQIYGVENIDILSEYYLNSNLRLDYIDEDDINRDTMLDNIINIVANTNVSKNKLNINNIYLPTFKTNILSKYVLECDEIIFSNKKSNQPYAFENDIKNWKANKIHIPNFIINIDKYKLPSTSNTSITRDFNESINKLIQNETLTIDNETAFDFESGSLISKISILDNYFYSFSSSPLRIKTINFTDNIINVNIPTNLLFFKSNLENKSIIIKNTVKSMSPSFWNNINIFSKNNNANLSREKWLPDAVLNNDGVLKLDLLYKLEEILNNTLNISTYLIGYEKIIKSIDLLNISEIKNSTFRDLTGWNEININLISTINVIDDYAFYNSDIKINIDEGFNPKTIKSYSFYSSTISGDLNFSNLDYIGDYAFYRTNIENIQFDNLLTINSNVFNSCSKLKKAILPKVNVIKDYSFSYCSSLIDFDFANILEIGRYAFNQCTSLSSISIEGVQIIKDYAFNGCSNISGNISLYSNVNLGNFVFQGFNSNVTIQNFNFNNYSIIGNLFLSSTSKFPNVISNKTNEYLYERVNFNISNKIWDLSKFTSNIWNDKEWFNDLWLFSNILKSWTNNESIFEEVILPNEGTINNNFSNIFNSKITIKKLTWNYNPNYSKTISKSLNLLFGSAKILSINEDFFVGMSDISNSFLPSSLINQKIINLQGISKIANNAFYGFKNIEFKNTLDVKEIGSKSFDSSVIFSIGTNVKLKEDSFTIEGLPDNNKITRVKIFEPSGSLNYGLIYDQTKKILDFTKAKLTNPINVNELFLYRGISDYLLYGDVQKIILPKIYVLSNDFFNDLGEIQEIIFQDENQVILPNSFLGTKIYNKPSILSTNIILDQDNFFN